MDLITFTGVVDRYSGVTVDTQEEPCDKTQLCDKISGIIEEVKGGLLGIASRWSYEERPNFWPLFVSPLHLLDIASLQKWSKENMRCIWFKVHIQDSEWVPVLAKEGFNFHHARDGFVMMFKWLPNDSTSNLPPAVHTSLGVGGMVFNENNQLLVVSEKHYGYPHWKLPGGYVEMGEDMKDAAIREVKEETGVDTVFESMVTLRHTHNMMFGNSDIYVIIKLKAVTDTIEKCEMEIKECQWMDVEEFLSHPHVHEFNRFLVRQAQDMEKRKFKLSLEKNEVKISNWSREITSLVVKDL